ARAGDDRDFAFDELHGEVLLRRSPRPAAARPRSAIASMPSQFRPRLIPRRHTSYALSMGAAELAERLARYLERAVGAPVTITGLRRLAGGASRETWAFDASIAGESEPRHLVLRRDPGPTSVDSDRAHEFAVLRAAHRCGVPVPEVHWLGDDPEPLGARFFVMDYVPGETLARRLLRDATYERARTVLPRQLGAILARIHAIDVEEHGLGFLPAPAEGRSPAAAELE